MNRPLAGKHALVTGGTRGIGKAIARTLRDRGARVTISGTRPVSDIPPGCEFRVCDFLDGQGLNVFADSLKTADVDILINNAGINKISEFQDIAAEDFDAIQQVNVVAPFRLSQAVLAHMKSQGWGRIVNISSIWGLISKAQRASYSISKFAIDGMTAALAAEVARDGILVNSVAPGFIDTELTRKVLGEKGITELVAGVPIGRLGQPEEIAAFVAWLASPENTYISGQNIPIDGGFSRV